MANAEPAPIVEWFLTAAPALMAILWVYQDAQRRRIAQVTDLGFFLIFFWPVAIPWYAFKSRGLAGWRLGLGLLALICAAPLTAITLYLLRG